MPTFDADFDDLIAFATHRDEQAFARVVGRYADFVYATCLRQVKDPGLADDAAQAVFVLLAQRAGKLNRSTRLVGWLFKAAGYASKNVIRSERRRKRHEKEAAVPATAAVPNQTMQRELEEILDGALGKLKDTDRDALLLRFFQGCTHEEIGEALGLTSHAAKMRVLRAIEKLRDQLTHDNVNIMPTALEAALLTLTTQSAPFGFAAAACKSALAGTSALATATARTMTLASLKTAAMVLGTMLAITGSATGIWLAARNPTTSNSASASAVTATTEPAWKAKFDSVYHLDKDQAVKWIGKPFIAERADFCRQMHLLGPGANSTPVDHLLFYFFDGAVQMQSAGCGSPRDYQEVLSWLTQLRSEEYLASNTFLASLGEGDWIVRPEASVEAKLTGLQNEAARYGMKLQLEKKVVQRDVLVASGTFEPERWKDGLKDTWIQLVVSEKGSNTISTMNGTVKWAFDRLSMALGRPVINEWRGLKEDRQVELVIEPGLRVGDFPKAQADAKLRGILAHLTEQTGLAFNFETRPIMTWVLTEASAPAGTTQVSIESAWRKEFDKVYVLAPDEDIRHILPPFIPARNGFLADRFHPDPSVSNGKLDDPNTSSASGSMIVEFDPATGRVERWRRANSTAWPALNLLMHLTEIPMANFVVNGKLTSPVPGDWIWRKGATGEQRLEGYRKAMEKTPQAFNWEKKTLKRDVIVAHGTFAPDEWPDLKAIVTVDLTGKTERNQGGDVGYFFRHLAGITGRPVINEWKGSELLRVEFDQPNLALNGLSKEAKDAKLTPILKHLSDQLHIELTVQTQDVESYVITQLRQK